jgi:hypothetical protein
VKTRVPAKRRVTRAVAPPARRFGLSSALVLAAAVVAGSVLLLSPTDEGQADGTPAVPSNRTPVAEAWPQAQRATITGTLSDGTDFVPGHFFDARTAVGTAPSRDGRALRLVIRQQDGSARQVRSVPAGRDQTFASFTSTAADLVWVETGSGTAPEIWAMDLRDRTAAARRLTADTGAATFFGSPYDLVVAGGRVYWATVPPGATVTEVRSVPLAGGAVTVRTEPGAWTLSAWPWLTDGSDQTSRARLRNLETNQDVEVTGSGTELLTCGPTRCRVTVVSDGGTRLEVMSHDRSARRVVADDTATPVGSDVAVLDRFELLFETQAGTDRTNAAALLVYDLIADRMVEVSTAVDGAFSRGGVLWWSTGDGDRTLWHTVDLRTV